MSKKIFFSEILLYIILAFGIVGTILSLMPLISQSDALDDKIAFVGEVISGIMEIVLISLIAYKVCKEGLKKPSYGLLVAYVFTYTLSIIISFVSEDLSVIFNVINLILFIVVGFAFLMGEGTKKIGIWLLLSIVGMILLLVFRNAEATHKETIVITGLMYIIPYYYYLFYCVKFLAFNPE